MGNIIQNNIIKYDTKPAKEFKANALNYRIHPEKQKEAVKSSLSELGWISVVIENKRTGNLIDGHERVQQALENNENVPYILVDLDENQEKIALALFDRITNMAVEDEELFDALKKDMVVEDEILSFLLSSVKEEEIDIDEMWQGMPEFENEDNKPFKSIIVHFDNAHDVFLFEGLVKQNINEGTKYIRFPKKENLDLINYKVQ